jgi:peptidoglycan-N-acetylglucosamine deacetylase
MWYKYRERANPSEEIMINFFVLHKDCSYLVSFAIFILLCFMPCQVHADIIEKLNVQGVALTFDTCETTTPSYFDDKILSYLIKEQIPFTIFITGKFAIRNQKRLQEIAKLPFVEIENHSFNHYQHMERLNADKIKKEVTDLDKLLIKMIGKKTKYFRFPAGNYDAKALKQIEQMSFKVVHWTFPSGDPDQNITPSKLTNWVVSKTKPGTILIFHINGRGYSTGDALPGIISSLRKKGIKFIKLEDGGI